MKIIRYLDESENAQFGWVHEDRAGLIEGSPFQAFRRAAAEFPLSDLHLLPPVAPSKIICVGRNYAAHAQEHEAEIPDLPLLFLKPPSSLIGTGETILLPPQSQRVEHEAELAVVIGKRSRWLDTEGAKDAVLGYTIANDVTARDLQRQIHGLADRQRTLREPELQALAVAIGHRDEELAVRAAVDVVDGADVRMVQRRSRASLLHETQARVFIARELW